MQHRLPALFGAAILACALAACTDTNPAAPALPPQISAPAAPAHSVIPTSTPVFDATGLAVGHPDDSLLLEADGSMAVQSSSDYAYFWSVIAPQLDTWAADTRLAINPNFVAAILTKESGFDSVAVSWMPANGLPQLTYIADADMQQMVTASDFLWMQPEVQAWPRNAIVHSSSATYDATTSGLQQGTITSANEYFFNPLQAVRGQVFWLRLLKNKWTTDTWPGGYGTFARNALNGGAALTESQLVDLVTVSYNQGYDWVYNLVSQYGPQWTAVLSQQGSAGVEAADYLDRVRNFTGVFEDAATSATSTSGGGGGGGTVTTTTVPASPANTGIWRENRSTIGVSWTDQSANETGFRVYRSANGGAFVLVGSVGANATRYYDSTFSHRTTYVYAVSSYNAAGESALVASGKLYVK